MAVGVIVTSELGFHASHITNQIASHENPDVFSQQSKKM
jgi:hypothetical protein